MQWKAQGRYSSVQGPPNVSHFGGAARPDKILTVDRQRRQHIIVNVSIGVPTDGEEYVNHNFYKMSFCNRSVGWFSGFCV